MPAANPTATRTDAPSWSLDHWPDNDDALVPWLEHNRTADEPDFTTFDDLEDTLDEIANDVSQTLYRHDGI